MALDYEPVKIAYALRVAKRYYSDEGYNHAIRVMQNVADNDIISSSYRDDCLVLAIMHDLFEDTEYLCDALPECTNKALNLLTKPKDKDYIEYIKEIKENVGTDWGMCAWWVKRADIKDHLSQAETLTERLKEKYLKALVYLL